MWGGDFNIARSLDIDRSQPAPHHYTKACAMLHSTLTDHNLIDAWRHLHPNDLEGTHFTAQAATWPRLDYIFLSVGLCPAILQVQHLARTYSDHAPVWLTLSSTDYGPPRSSWRLQPTILLDTVFQEELRVEIKDFFIRNKDSVDSVEIIWEAFKVPLQGFCIAKGAGMLKDILNTLRTLETELKSLESRLVTRPDGITQSQFRSKLTAYMYEARREARF